MRKLTRTEKQRQSRLGATPEQVDFLMELQDGRCMICRNPPGKRGLALDHNHKTQQIRALLCAQCNMGLGNFKENPELLLMAHAYLELYDGKH